MLLNLSIRQNWIPLIFAVIMVLIGLVFKDTGYLFTLLIVSIVGLIIIIHIRKIRKDD